MTIFTLLVMYVGIVLSVLVGILLVDNKDSRDDRSQYRAYFESPDIFERLPKAARNELRGFHNEIPIPLRKYANSSQVQFEVEAVIEKLWERFGKVTG